MVIVAGVPATVRLTGFGPLIPTKVAIAADVVAGDPFSADQRQPKPF
jgi:hypothetical protein